MISVGTVVMSKAGRDAKRAFVVVQVVDEEYVLLCDGDLRKLDKPKKKKLKHIKPLMTVAPMPVIEGRAMLDADIRKHLLHNGNSKEV